jgi:hypothetical protein
VKLGPGQPSLRSSGEFATGPPSLASVSPPLKSPKDKGAPEGKVIMGEIVKGGGIPPRTSKPYAPLEAALERLKRAVGIAGDGSGEDGASG